MDWNYFLSITTVLAIILLILHKTDLTGVIVRKVRLRIGRMVSLDIALDEKEKGSVNDRV